MFEDDEPPTPGPDEIVVLGEVDGEGSAILWRDILEQRGIHSMAKNLSAIAYTRHGGPWAVYVQYRDLRLAREAVGLDVDEPDLR
jgi:hypothetical protein